MIEIKDIAQYEDTDSELAKYTIRDLQHRINIAINYTTKQMKKYEGYNLDFEIVLSNIVVILGSDKE